MALGYHDFAPGEILTATNVDGMMRQTVMTFATAAARDSALSGVLDEGMVAYTVDTKRYWSFDATNWVITGGAWPAVSCTRTTTLSLTDNTETDVPLVNELYDTDAFHTASAAVFTIPTGLGGDYMFSSMLEIAANATGIRRLRTAIASNTTTTNEVADVDVLVGAAGAVFATIVSGSDLLRLEAGATLTLKGTQNSGGALNVQNAAMRLIMMRHIPTLT